MEAITTCPIESLTKELYSLDHWIHVAHSNFDKLDTIKRERVLSYNKDSAKEHLLAESLHEDNLKYVKYLEQVKHNVEKALHYLKLDGYENMVSDPIPPEGVDYIFDDPKNLNYYLSVYEIGKENKSKLVKVETKHLTDEMRKEKRLDLVVTIGKENK